MKRTIASAAATPGGMKPLSGVAIARSPASSGWTMSGFQMGSRKFTGGAPPSWHGVVPAAAKWLTASKPARSEPRRRGPRRSARWPRRRSASSSARSGRCHWLAPDRSSAGRRGSRAAMPRRGRSARLSGKAVWVGVGRPMLIRRPPNRRLGAPDRHSPARARVRSSAPFSSAQLARATAGRATSTRSCPPTSPP